MDFLTALRAFNFLCLPPKGFFIDKALCSAGSEVCREAADGEISDQGRAGAGGWVAGRAGEPGTLGQGLGGRHSGQGWAAENRSQVCCAQGPSVGEQVAKPETGVLKNRFLETDLSDQLRQGFRGGGQLQVSSTRGRTPGTQIRVSGHPSLCVLTSNTVRALS